MKLHWSPRSPFVRKVMVVAHETGLADRLTLVRSVVAMTAINPAVMADNPLNKIPTLVLDDGSVLFDSLVICLYLDSLHEGPRLAPSGAAGLRTLARHALSNGFLDLVILWRNERERPPELRSEPHLKAYETKALATLAVLEAQAAELSGTSFDLAQVTLGCALGYLDFRFDRLGWREGRPELTAFFERFSSRASARATTPHE
ncbi:MAG TPA: glutathione S-transferase N-terminal domain-containing protein [Caulobacteraceae bacterium]|jgi:glutathione S-transferase|nr:glutathione S-transferase N-terminal domain-containing protein [Caulobacteraceae bacterium]